LQQRLSPCFHVGPHELKDSHRDSTSTGDNGTLDDLGCRGAVSQHRGKEWCRGTISRHHAVTPRQRATVRCCTAAQCGAAPRQCTAARYYRLSPTVPPRYAVPCLPCKGAGSPQGHAGTSVGVILRVPRGTTRGTPEYLGVPRGAPWHPVVPRGTSMFKAGGL
jgi:hypothetical protein